jgi:hypothetical protein
MAKVVPESTHLFFPIDAFYGVTDEAAQAARGELEALLRQYCGASTRTFWVDKANPAIPLD